MTAQEFALSNLDHGHSSAGLVMSTPRAKPSLRAFPDRAEQCACRRQLPHIQNPRHSLRSPGSQCNRRRGHPRAAVITDQSYQFSRHRSGRAFRPRLSPREGDFRHDFGHAPDHLSARPHRLRLGLGTAVRHAIETAHPTEMNQSWKWKIKRRLNSVLGLTLSDGPEARRPRGPLQGCAAGRQIRFRNTFARILHPDPN